MYETKPPQLDVTVRCLVSINMSGSSNNSTWSNGGRPGKTDETCSSVTSCIHHKSHIKYCCFNSRLQYEKPASNCQTYVIAFYICILCKIHFLAKNKRDNQ